MKITTLIATLALVNGRRPSWFKGSSEYISVEEAWKLCNPNGKEVISFNEFMADNCIGPAVLRPNFDFISKGDRNEWKK